jgi:hypothetical protein
MRPRGFRREGERMFSDSDVEELEVAKLASLVRKIEDTLHGQPLEDCVSSVGVVTTSILVQISQDNPHALEEYIHHLRKAVADGLFGVN